MWSHIDSRGLDWNAGAFSECVLKTNEMPRQRRPMKTCFYLLMVTLLLGCNARRTSTGLNDARVSKLLTGRWTFGLTNDEGMQLSGHVIYQTNGSAIWRGTMSKMSGNVEVFEFTGLWRVQDGFLCTRATGAAFPYIVPQQEFQDQLLAVSDTEFKYRTVDGFVDTRHRLR
jgi:hypothetical protein